MKFLEARQLVDRAAQHPAYPLRVALSGTLAPLDLYLRAHLARHGWHAALDTLPFGTLQQWLRTGEADPARDLLVLLPWDLLPALDWRTGLPADPLDEATIAAALDDARQLLAPLAAQGVPLFYLAAPVPPVADTPRAQQWLEAQLHALAYATRDRKARKRQFRELWIIRINAGARQHGMTYGRFVAGLRRAEVAIDRKVLADLAVRDAGTFARLVEVARGA